MLMRIALLTLPLAAAPAQAVGFHCHVTPESQQCDFDGCAETGHYMDISVDAGTLSFCEGEGCAEGKVLMRRELPGVSFAYAMVKRSGGSQPAFALSLMYDRQARVVHIASEGDNRIVKCAAE